jgi:hypothetical protein
MDYIRNCHIYSGTKCNCPPGSCRREKSELETIESENNIRLSRERLLNDLIDFQVYLKNEGYINDEDWVYQEQAEIFLNQR